MRSRNWAVQGGEKKLWKEKKMREGERMKGKRGVEESKRRKEEGKGRKACELPVGSRIGREKERSGRIHILSPRTCGTGDTVTCTREQVWENG